MAGIDPAADKYTVLIILYYRWNEKDIVAFKKFMCSKLQHVPVSTNLNSLYCKLI